MKDETQSNAGYEYDEAFFIENQLNCRNFSIIANAPHTMFLIKDLQTRTVMANTPMLRAWGHYNKKNIIGLKNSDFVYGKLCQQYTKDDEYIYKGNRIENRTEIVAGFDSNTLILVNTTKYPLYDLSNKIIGLIAVCKTNIDCDDVNISPIINYMKDNVERNIKIQELASVSNKSVSAFERSFKQKYNTTPLTYFNFVKINRACILLKHTDKTVAEISHSLGFYDQSYMCRLFKTVIGVTPKDYRLY